MIISVGERIKNRRLELGLPVEDVAKKLGKNRATVYRYESSFIENLPIQTLEPLAKILMTSPAYLMGWTDNPNEGVKAEERTIQYKNLHHIETRKIPMVGKVACGQPIMCEEDYDSYAIADSSVHADVCLTCVGDSMIGARINDGDIVFIHIQQMVENGEIAAVIIDNEVTLKRVYYYPEQGKLILQAENPKYAPLVFMGEELNQIEIYGKAVFFQSNII